MDTAEWIEKQFPTQQDPIILLRSLILMLHDSMILVGPLAAEDIPWFHRQKFKAQPYSLRLQVSEVPIVGELWGIHCTSEDRRVLVSFQTY